MIESLQQVTSVHKSTVATRASCEMCLQNQNARWKTALLALGAASLEVQRRPLTPAEARSVVSQIAESAEISGYSMSEWTGGKDTFALIDPGTNSLLGAVLVHHLALNWSEVAVVFVLKGYRGLGLGNYMLANVLRTLEHGDRNILLFFSKENMRQLVSARGFEIYESQDEFCGRSVFNLFYFRVLYQVQWLSNAYRRKELKRKRQDLGADFSFRVAVKKAMSAVYSKEYLRRADIA
jgi:ribosomal protein S18 acetylase RimI-like enzyme